jgi:glycosyltransferase involved in cell wall biosynthesis
MSGIGTYIQNLMKNDCYQIALGNREEIKKLNKIDENNIVDFNSKIYGIKEQLKFPYKKLRKLRPSVLHVPHYNVPIFYCGKMITTIHDLTHLVLPEFLPNKFAKFYAKFMMRRAIKKSYKILTVSENTKKDILKYFKVDPNKIEVIYNGVSDEFVKKDKKKTQYVYEKFNIPTNKKILMYVGNLKPHKNLERLLEAYSKTKCKKDTCLLLVGKAFEKYNVLEDKEKDLKIDNNVIHTGIVSQEELVDLYNIADLFIFPSLYEGFGLPVLESLKCGTPVICSNNSSIPEVGGDLVDYFDPYNDSDIAKSIDENLNNKVDHDKVKKHIMKFDWKNHAKKMKEVICDEGNCK